MLSRTEKNKKTRKKINKLEKREKRKKFFIKFFKIIFVLAILIIGFLTYIRYIATNNITVREYSPDFSTLPESFHGFKIVQFGDVYYNQYTINIDKLISQINELKPDLIVFTGGLKHKNYTFTKDDIDSLIKSLTKLDSTVGKYYVVGSYDDETVVDILNKSGFKILDEEDELIYFNSNTPILLRGIREKYDIDYKDNKELFKINIVHESDKAKEIIKYNSPEIIMSGNSLNGQIRLPYMGALIKPDGSKNYYEEYYKLEDTNLYITGGIGTNNYPIRLFNHPSINFYRLRKK